MGGLLWQYPLTEEDTELPAQGQVSRGWSCYSWVQVCRAPVLSCYLDLSCHIGVFS